MLADMPVSLAAYALGWHHPRIATLWIVAVGTLWWFFLTRAALYIFGVLRNLR